MSRFDSGRSLICLVSAALVGSVLNATAQDNRSGAYLSFIQQLTRAAYIDLVDESTVVSINLGTPLGRDWYPHGIVHLFVREFRVEHPSAHRVQPPTKSEPQRPKEPLVEAVFEAANGYLDSVRFKGPYAVSMATRDLKDQALAHPEWSDEDMSAAMKRAGARFGMAQKNEFVRDAGVERIASVFGRVRSMNARFLWRRTIAPPQTTVVGSPMWAVDLEIDAAHGERQCYSLGFDPFTLRLNFVVAFECK